MNFVSGFLNRSISVHALTDDPTEAWRKICKTQKVLKIQPPLPKGPPEDNKVCNIYYEFTIFGSITLSSGESRVYE